MKRVCMHCGVELQPMYKTALHPHQPIPEPLPPETEEQKNSISHGICQKCFCNLYFYDEEEDVNDGVCHNCDYADHAGAEDTCCPNCEEEKS